MNTRLHTLLARENHTLDVTKTIEINVADPISQILVSWEPDAHDSGLGSTGHPIRGITKIEVVDGSEVVYSLSGAEAQGVDFYHNKKEAFSAINYMTDMYSKVVAQMNFGRYLFDPVNALVPGNFKALQLKITLDVSAGGASPDDGYLTVLAQLFDEKEITPTGFIMTKEVKKYTLADTSHEYTSLPTDYLYKQLYLRAQKYGTLPTELIDTVKLSEDGDKRIPVDHTMAQIIANQASFWPLYSERNRSSGAITVVYFHCAPAQDERITGAGWRAAADIGPIAYYSASGGRYSLLMDDHAGNIQSHITGYAPHGVVPLLPDFGMDIADWYDVTKIGKLNLDVLAGTGPDTTDTAEIIVEQLKTY